MSANGWNQIKFGTYKSPALTFSDLKYICVKIRREEKKLPQYDDAQDDDAGKILKSTINIVSCPTRLSSSWWWRPQNAPFEKCSIWELLHLRIAPFEKCSIWEMFALRIAPFEKCSIWETWGWRQILHFEKAAISIKMVKFRISRQFSIKEGAVYHEIINGPSEQGLELYHLYYFENIFRYFISENKETGRVGLVTLPKDTLQSCTASPRKPRQLEYFQGDTG